MGGKHSKKKKVKDNTLEVLVGKTTHRITVSPNPSVDSIFEKIREKTDVDVVILKCFEKIIKPGMRNDYGQPMRLSDLGISLLSRLSVVWPTSRPRKIKLTTDKDKPCVISGDDDDKTPRVLMPCGHAITKESLNDHCTFEVSSKEEHQIICAKCDAVWEWSFVQQVCQFTDEEQTNITKKMTENNLKYGFNYFNCPDCHAWSGRLDNNVTIVRCQNCTTKKGRNVDFCFSCNIKINENSKSCTDDVCNGNIEKLNHLKNCKTKRIDGVTFLCPDTRACPNCNILTKHETNCKRVKCERCKIIFCFVCLQSLKSQKRIFDDHKACELAPVQTTFSKK